MNALQNNNLQKNPRRAAVSPIFPKECPLREVLDRVGDQWSFLTIAVLETGTFRFGELRHRIGDISPRVLTQTLRGLELDGLVQRTPYATIPPRVDYTITELGRSLAEAMRPLIAWAHKHESAIHRRRRQAV